MTPDASARVPGASDGDAGIRGDDSVDLPPGGLLGDPGFPIGVRVEVPLAHHVSTKGVTVGWREAERHPWRMVRVRHDVGAVHATDPTRTEYEYDWPVWAVRIDEDPVVDLTVLDGRSAEAISDLILSGLSVRYARADLGTALFDALSQAVMFIRDQPCWCGRDDHPPCRRCAVLGERNGQRVFPPGDISAR